MHGHHYFVLLPREKSDSFTIPCVRSHIHRTKPPNKVLIGHPIRQSEVAGLCTAGHRHDSGHSKFGPPMRSCRTVAVDPRFEPVPLRLNH